MTIEELQSKIDDLAIDIKYAYRRLGIGSDPDMVAAAESLVTEREELIVKLNHLKQQSNTAIVDKVRDWPEDAVRKYDRNTQEYWIARVLLNGYGLHHNDDEIVQKAMEHINEREIQLAALESAT